MVENPPKISIINENSSISFDTLLQGKRVSFVPEPSPTNEKPALTNGKPALTNTDDKPTEDSGVESGQWEDDTVRHAQRQDDPKDDSKAGVYIFSTVTIVVPLSLSQKCFAFFT